jgi:hypothetical protein
MIIRKFSSTLSPINLFAQLTAEVLRASEGIKEGELLVLGICPIATKWSQVPPFAFVPEEHAQAFECLKKHYGDYKGPRFLPSCSIECAIYIVNDAKFSEYIEGTATGLDPEDEVFCALSSTMKRMLAEEESEKETLIEKRHTPISLSLIDRIKNKVFAFFRGAKEERAS